MSYSTVYDVRVRYSVDNRAGRTGTQGLTKDTRALGNEAKRTSGLFGRLGVAVAAAFGARQAGRALIGFNSTVEDTKNQIAGMLALSKKTDLSDQVAVADRLYSRLQKRAASLPGTTQEYVQMLGMLTQPLSSAGATLKEMEDLTVNAVVGAKALGISWDVAARDIDQALRGQFHSTDQFTGKILGSMGYQGEEGRAKFNNMSADKRKDALQAALMQKQLTQLAAAQGASFSGMVSTLQDTIEQFAGKVGGPLFRVLKTELQELNGWIDTHGPQIEAFATRLGDALVVGFHAVKEAVGFLVDHADVLIMAGKLWAGVKVGGMLASGAGMLGDLASGAGGGGVKGLMGWFRGRRDSYDDEGNYVSTPAGRGQQAVGGLNGVLQNAGMLAGAGMIGYQIGNMLGLDKVGEGIGSSLAQMTGRADGTTLAMEKLARETDHLAKSTAQAAIENEKKSGAIKMAAGVALDYKTKADLVESTDAAWKKMKASGSMEDTQWYLRHKADMNAAGVGDEDLKQYGGAQGYVTAMRSKAGTITGRNTQVDATMSLVPMMFSQLTEYQRKTLETEQAQEQIATYVMQTLASGGKIDNETVMEILRRNTQDPTGTHKNMADRPKVNVTINRIEVQSDDPDRMAFGLIESFRDAAKNPSSALSSLREG